jgi:carotenoid cleavage dioxygenase-like enzyme
MVTVPAYLEGLLAPVSDEIDAVNLPVTGRIPAELAGRYFRNGPNPLPGQDPGHWFAGDGMLHGIRIRDGKAGWYRNRWVKTTRLQGAQHRSEKGVDRAAVTANTSVIRHGGKIFALVENGFPYEITPELDTVGPCDFGGRLTSAMTAHPKEDPVTGELHLFGYDVFPPFITYHRLTREGELVETRTIDVPGPTMVHDFAITENHVIWLDLPAVFDLQLVGQGLPFRWDDGYGARLGVMPKTGGDVQWFDIDPCYVFHVGNAHEDNGRIVLDAVRYSRQRFTDIWNQVSDRPSQFLYAVSDNAIVKYDTVTGGSQARELGKAPGEADFVAKQDAKSEDDGWLMSIVTEHDCSGSELLIADAVSLETVASVRLPRRVPAGFHGNWLPDA